MELNGMIYRILSFLAILNFLNFSLYFDGIFDNICLVSYPFLVKAKQIFSNSMMETKIASDFVIMHIHSNRLLWTF